MSRSYVDDFLLLKRRPFRDRDDIVEGIGRSTGRLSAVVKGKRKSGAGGGVLDPPVLLQVNLRSGGGLFTLSQPVLMNVFPPLRRDLPRLLTAGFLGRLFLASMAETSPEPGLFELLKELFLALGEGGIPALCGLWGQEHLLAALGLSPFLDSCLECGSPDVSGFSAIDGGVLCRGCYRGCGFSLSSGGLDFCRQLRCLSLLDLPRKVEASVVRSAGRLYKEQFQVHLGLGDYLFRRVLPPARKKKSP